MQHRLSWLIIIVLVLSISVAACSPGPITPAERDAAPPAEEAAEAPPADEAAEESASPEAVESGAEAAGEPAETGDEAAEAAPEAGAGAPEEPASAEAADTSAEAPAAGASADADELLPQADTQSETAAAAELPEQQFGLVVTNLNDKGFNDLAWAGMQRAAEELDVAVRFAQDSNPGTALARINQFINQGYEGIVTVGFEMARATKTAAEAHPNVPMAIVDFPSQAENVQGLLFDVDAPAFMAGYLAAGMSQTGVVCTYGGQKIPPVLIFMVGFEQGVEYYNAQNEADVTVLGWRTDASLASGGEGVFATNFSNQTFGRIIAAELALQGCDIIFPVAGAVGLGTAAVAAENDLTLIGVDADQSLSNSQYADLYLTSVVKHVDQAVYETVAQMAGGSFAGGRNYIGTLANGGVGLAPFHSFEEQVPPELKTALDAVRQDLIDGRLSTGWPVGAAPLAAGMSGGSLNLAALRSATYTVQYTADDLAPLRNGVYVEPVSPDGVAGTRVTLANQMAYGDLTGDGQNEAVVVLVSNTSGTGVFHDLAVMADQDGAPVQLASAFLGDRIQLNDLEIENGLVKVTMVTQGPGDAQCCPTQQVVKIFGLEEGELVELSSQVVGEAAAAPPAPATEPEAAPGAEAEPEAEPAVPAGEEPAQQPEPASLADIQGRWLLVELGGGQPLLPETEIAAEFSDGQVRGSAGCNLYLARVTAGEDQTLSVSPPVSVKKACPEPILSQESDYLRKLENVTQASLLAGQLILSYDLDGATGQLTFTAQE